MLNPFSKKLNSIERCHNIEDLRVLAKKNIPAAMFHYIDGAAEDEWTAKANVNSFDNYQFSPNALVNVDNIDLSTSVLGQQLDWPVICAPTGMSRLFHHQGEKAVARAAANSKTLYCVSSMSSVTLEDIAIENGKQNLFQIYVFRDRELNKEFIARCKASNYAALCLTVDVAVAGNRERDIRTGMTIPPSMSITTLFDIALHPKWLWHNLTNPNVNFANLAHKITSGANDVSTLYGYIASQFDPTVTWDDAAWMIKEWGGPFAIKGILTVEDAKRAVSIGASAIIVSNHGGRQLDGLPASIDTLAAIAEAVGDKVEIIFDSGIRRGTHVLKAIAMGADACMIGRPYLYGLAAGGEAGVKRALNILQTELKRDMALLGCQSLSDVNSDMLHSFK